MTENVTEDLNPPSSVLDDLPGDLVMWILIVSELAVFGTGLLAFLAVRLGDPEGFATSQDQLHRVSAGINTVVLVTSGWFAARAAQSAHEGRSGPTRLNLALGGLLGLVFLILKGLEYADAAAKGLGTETHPFFTFYWLLTGFHAAHVVAGIVIMALVAIRTRADQVEDGMLFWHMVDLVWVILFPVIYLLR